MKIVQMPVSSMLVNAYFYYDENTKDAVLIDPGAQGDKLNQFIDEEGLLLSAILLTHGHFDHIGGVDEVREHTGAPVYIHKEEAALLADPELNEARLMMRRELSVKADRLMEDKDVITVGSAELEVIFTPGHTPGGVSYYAPKSNALFSGDTLFHESIGRSDLAGGNMGDLLKSIQERLFVLPDDTAVLPGHGSASTIGHEKKHNPFVRIDGRR